MDLHSSIFILIRVVNGDGKAGARFYLHSSIFILIRIERRIIMATTKKFTF